MKYMKLGLRPDAFHSEGSTIRYVATELATDITVKVGDVKFYLHKFPLLSKCPRLERILVSTSETNNEEIDIPDIPGGPAAFEICAKYCYGMIVTLNAYNLVAVRCAAEYLEMHETIEKGNLIHKIDVFLNSSIFRSWKDSIIILQTAKSLQPWSEDLKLVSHCIESLASKVSIDPGEVEWSYTYNRKKLPSENGVEIQWNGVRKLQSVPKDWWVEDLCELEMDSYKQVIMSIKTKGRVNGEIIGEALKAYACKRLPGFNEITTTHEGDYAIHQVLLETIVWLLPTKRGSVSCSFLLKLFKQASFLDCSESCRNELMNRIGKQMEEASVADLLIPAPVGEITLYDIDLVLNVMEFLMHSARKSVLNSEELEEARNPARVSGNLSITVVKLIDGYLAEAAKDPNLPILKFVELAGLASGSARPVHDELYRAIDSFLKEHPDLTKSEKKKICRLMDCRKLSPDASLHALQNDRLPLRVVVQLLYFEQLRLSSSAPATGGAAEGSSISNGKPMAGDIKLNGRVGGLSESSGGRNVKGVVMPRRILGKLWSGKVPVGDNSSSDTSESPGSINRDEAKFTPSRNIRYSVS